MSDEQEITAPLEVDQLQAGWAVKSAARPRCYAYLAFGAKTDLGRVRENNDDKFDFMEPDEPSVLYNVACVYAQAGEKDRAVELLERAVLPGMANRIWLEHDRDLDGLRELPRFKAFVATLK